MGILSQIRQRLGAGAATAQGAPAGAAPASNKQRGDAAEASAVAYLQRQGLVLLQRNYKTPGRGGGEIDAIMRSPDGTVVFVEVRRRSGARHGGAAASISRTKQRRVVLAAQHWLLQHHAEPPPCRFDVMASDGQAGGAAGTGGSDADGNELCWRWLPGAFDAQV